MDVDQQIGILDHALLAQVNSEFPEVLNDAEKASVNAYLVLSHAILEEFLEEAFEGYIGKLEDWLRPPIPSQVPAEIAFFCFSAGAVRGNLSGYSSASVYQLVKETRSNLTGKIRANNGLKTKDIQGLAKCAGVDWPSLEADLASELADLETLGASRGEAGHLSPFTNKSRVLSGQDYPDDVRDWVKSARIAAEKIVARLESLPNRS